MNILQTVKEFDANMHLSLHTSRMHMYYFLRDDIMKRTDTTASYDMSTLAVALEMWHRELSTYVKDHVSDVIPVFLEYPEMYDTLTRAVVVDIIPSLRNSLIFKLQKLVFDCQGPEFEIARVGLLTFLKDNAYTLACEAGDELARIQLPEIAQEISELQPLLPVKPPKPNKPLPQKPTDPIPPIPEESDSDAEETREWEFDCKWTDF